MALSSLGHQRIITALTDQGKEALLCSTWYAPARKSVLAAADWTGLAKPSPVMQGSVSGHGLFYYPFPFAGDALRFKALTPAGKEADIETADHAVLSREPELSFTYVEDIDEPDDWPQGVADAVAYDLAARIALSLTGDFRLADKAEKKAADKLSIAKAHDANLTRRHGTENRYADARHAEGWN
jgi:hypothetical protein